MDVKCIGRIRIATVGFDLKDRGTQKNHISEGASAQGRGSTEQDLRLRVDHKIRTRVTDISSAARRFGPR